MKNSSLTITIVAASCLGAGFGLGKMWSRRDEGPSGGAAAARMGAPPAVAGGTMGAAPVVEPVRTGRNSLAGMTRDEVKQRTLAVLREHDYFLRWEGLNGILAGMNEQNAAGVVEAVQERHETGAGTMREGEAIQFREGQVLKAAAMKDLPAEPNGKPSYPLMNKMKGWASADPASARAWIENLDPGQLKNTLMRNWNEGLSQASPEVVAEIFPSLSPEQQRPLIGGLLTGLLDAGGFPAVQEWYEANTKSQTVAPGVIQEAFSNIMDRMAQSPQHWDEMFSFIKSQSGTVDMSSIGFGTFFRRVAPGEPGKCLDMLAELNKSSPAIQGQLDSMIGQTIEHSTSRSLNTLANWLEGHRDHPLYDRTVQQFARRTFADDAEAALRWADTITDESLREETKASFPAR